MGKKIAVGSNGCKGNALCGKWFRVDFEQVFDFHSIVYRAQVAT